jgi:hypothetical protein
MTISDYATLQTEVASWSHRTDLTARIPGFIQMVESELFRELTLRAVEASVSGTTSGDTIAIPAGLTAFERIEIESNGHRHTLNYSSPNGVEALTGTTGRASRYLIEGGAIRLLAAPSGPYNYTVFYIPLLTALSGTNTTNWLLTNHPDIYLKATLAQVAKFTQNETEMARLFQEVTAALDSIKRADERKRFPIAGGMQIKPRSYR